MSNTKPLPKNPQKGAFQTAIILAVVHIALTAFVLIASYLSESIQMEPAAIITVSIAIISGISAVQIRANRVTLGGWLMIGGVALLVPFTSALTSQNEWVSLISLIANISSQFISQLQSFS